MLCPACQAPNDDTADACFTCGRAFAALTRGTLIAGRYEVLSPLGKGGMGMVYKAQDRMLDEAVAIKVLRSEFAHTPEMAKRFRHEIKLARKVSHRNVCRIYEYGEDQGVRYISMEFVEGTDLRQLMDERGGQLEVEEACDVATQAAEGLQAIHDVGIIHRDLKTTNIMRDSRGAVRLMDFGIAKVENTDLHGLTITGQVMGTPEYMSPEQCFGEKLDHRCDIYALGVVFYETLTGSVPFHGDTPVATLFKHIQDPVPLDGPVGGRIPTPVAAVLRRALAKNRADRYATASAMAEALRGVVRALAHGAPTAGMAALSPADSGGHESESDRRRVTRLDIFVNLVLRRVGSLGTVLQEERTIAENVGRHGARVLTTMSTLVPGDIVQIEEVGGPFKTRAEVRGVYEGRDHIRRLNVRFLDSPAPDYLVHVEE
jgi:serine/threonine protein kinase